MNFEGNIIRPPAEHNSILLEAAVGCSHNSCSFCGLYKGERFRIKSIETIRSDLDYAGRVFPHKKRLFLCGGDALIIPQARLVEILQEIKKRAPQVVRVGLYGSAKSLKRKSVEELKELKSLGLGIVYFGLESGDDVTLERACKGVDRQEQVAEARKVREAGMKLSVTVLLGLGGRERSLIHAEETGRALSEISPNYIGALSLMVAPEVPIYNEIMEGRFELISPEEMLAELKVMLEHTNIECGVFSANHASNYLPLQIRLPGGKDEAIEMIEEALAGKTALRPEWMRGI